VASEQKILIAEQKCDRRLGREAFSRLFPQSPLVFFSALNSFSSVRHYLNTWNRLNSPTPLNLVVIHLRCGCLKSHDFTRDLSSTASGKWLSSLWKLTNI